MMNTAKKKSDGLAHRLLEKLKSMLCSGSPRKQREVIIEGTYNVLRHCRANDLIEERILQTAFELKECEDGINSGPSVNCVELLSGHTKIEKLDSLRTIFRRQVKKSHRFGEFNVNQLIQAANSIYSGATSLRVQHAPLSETEIYKADDSHCEIFAPLGHGTNADDPRSLRLREALAETQIDIHPAKL